jgi:DNA-binding CsgD family transcriptional regulator
MNGAAPELTPREVDTLRLVAAGLTKAAIARRHGVSEHTVKTHTTALFRKLGATSGAQAVAAAYERGLLVPAYLSPEERWWLLDRRGERITTAPSSEEAGRLTALNERVHGTLLEARLVSPWRAG